MTLRPPRAIRVDALEFEGRLLMTAVPVLIAPATIHNPPNVPSQNSLGFVGTPTPGTSQVTQIVTQQAGTATVTLTEIGDIGPLQVEVKTDSSSPAVGVNVGAVDQTVTFLEGQSQVTLSVPILAGAPNPGEVDVTLTATPVNPPTSVTIGGPLVLRILASDSSIPPTITTEQGTPRGIVLTFSKPMDPAAAANVQNYAVRAKTSKFNTAVSDVAILLGHVDGYGPATTFSSYAVPLRAAVYDPATNSVTLIPRRRLTYSAQITVTQGSGSKKPSRPGHPSVAPLGLTDVEGNLINGDSTPGRFGVGIGSGNPQPIPATNTVVSPLRPPQKPNRQLLSSGR